jgi:bacillithiol system protein YtxJ
MFYFHKTTHLSQILEESSGKTIIIFKYSSKCGSSERLAKKLEKMTAKITAEKSLKIPIYKITVQTEPALSNKISQWFDIKHETPQILVIKDSKVVYCAHHNAINIDDVLSL